MLLPAKTLLWASAGTLTLFSVVTGVVLAEAVQVDSVTGLGLLAGSGTVIAILFKLLIASKDREFAVLMREKDQQLLQQEGLKKSYQEIATEAVKSATETTNYYRHQEGKPPLIAVAPVIPESHSPPSPKQQEDAKIQSLRAEMAAIKIVTGQPARVPSESEGTPKESKVATDAPGPSPGAVVKVEVKGKLVENDP